MTFRLLMVCVLTSTTHTEVSFFFLSTYIDAVGIKMIVTAIGCICNNPFRLAGRFPAVFSVLNGVDGGANRYVVVVVLDDFGYF